MSLLLLSDEESASAGTPIGNAGVATLVPDVQQGMSITMQWQTDVIPSWSGKEQRIAVLERPRQRYEFSALLTLAQERKLLATMARRAAGAPTFLLALPHEKAAVESSTSTTVTALTLAYSDWAVAGQRIVVEGTDGTVAHTFIESVLGSELVVNDDVSAQALSGARVMPTMQVTLEAQQGFERYEENLARWNLVAHAQRFRYGTDGEMGIGASLTEYDGMPVWTKGIVVESTTRQPMFSGADLADLGGLPSSIGNLDVPQWMRALVVASSNPGDWQWLKLFLDTVKGRWKTFLLRTYREDLLAIGDASSGTLTIDSSEESYIESWHPSRAHRRLAIVLADKTVHYRRVESTSGGGATEGLVLDSPLVGEIERVEFLETARLDSDEVTVTFTGMKIRADLSARVVIDIDEEP